MELNCVLQVIITGVLVFGEGLVAAGKYNGNKITPLQRHKRNVDCLDKYKTIPDHTACLTTSTQATDSGVSAGDQTKIVELHNTYRKAEAASNMQKMSWDEEIAMIAQKWADNCELEHDTNSERQIPGYLNLGQNLAMGANNWTHAIDLWQQEVNVFTYGADDNDFHAVGHYTQLVWAETNKVGCGYAVCSGTKYFVCNYGPAGNIGGYNRPYKQGTKCGDCAGHCVADLCDCSLTCLSSAVMHVNNCTCTCRRDFYTGSTCDLDCSLIAEDPDYCTTGDYANSGCSVTAVDCPHKCHVCPYADGSYVEGSVPIVSRDQENHGNFLIGNVSLSLSMAFLISLIIRGN